MVVAGSSPAARLGCSAPFGRAIQSTLDLVHLQMWCSSLTADGLDSTSPYKEETAISLTRFYYSPPVCHQRQAMSQVAATLLAQGSTVAPSALVAIQSPSCRRRTSAECTVGVAHIPVAVRLWAEVLPGVENREYRGRIDCP